MLLSAEELALHLDDPSWVVFDCRHDLIDLGKGERAWRAGHIPGARFAPVETALSGRKTGANGRHPLPLPEAFADFLGRHGVSSTSTVIAYDDAGGPYAARLWWLARWIGLANVALLDGGWSKWIEAQRPIETAVPETRSVSLEAHPDSSMVWNAAQLLSRLKDPQIALVDARSPERYRGEVEPVDPVAGHIPSAVNRFHKQNLNPDLTLRPADELRREFAALLEGKLPAAVVHQCGSGITACANLFAMEYAGLPGSKLYAGSWSEWIADSSRPVMRETTAL